MKISVIEQFYICFWKGNGYIAAKQDKGSIYKTYTQNKAMARMYKTKQAAARAHNFKRWNSATAMEQLVFETVTVTTTREFRSDDCLNTEMN